MEIIFWKYLKITSLHGEKGVSRAAVSRATVRKIHLFCKMTIESYWAFLERIANTHHSWGCLPKYLKKKRISSYVIRIRTLQPCLPGLNFKHFLNISRNFLHLQTHTHTPIFRTSYNSAASLKALFCCPT